MEMEVIYREDHREEKMRYRAMRKKKKMKRMAITAAIGLAVGLALGIPLGNIGKKKLREEVVMLTDKLHEANEEMTEAKGELINIQNQEALDAGEYDLPWNLVLVNKWNPMEEGYRPPELTRIEDGMEVDSRIAVALETMIADARAAGLSPFICSSHRSVERQEELFDLGMKQRLNSGLGYYEAYLKTASVVAVPGTSEHALGLAVDIISVGNTNLDESQEETAEFKWFQENCYKYGFILRYPNGTTDITGIIYEPWHYRYVGVEVAEEIQALGVTFEEYIQDYYLK